jgi:hypothetical protein
MRFAIVIVLLPVLAGCASQPDALADAQMTYHNQDDNECRSQGTTVGTDPYLQCKMSLAKSHLEEKAALEAQRRALANAPPNPQQ